jgi:acyl-coenzyme A thioesterase PaaI-like protein
VKYKKSELNCEIVPMSSESSTPGSDKLSLPADKELVLKVIPMPADCNANGDIFGGWVMAQVDLAGSVLPARYVNGRMATVAVNQFIFKQPVKVGHTVIFCGGHPHRQHLHHGAGGGVCRTLSRARSLHQSH